MYKQTDGSFNTAADGTGTTVAAGDVIASMNNGAGSTSTATKLTNVAPAVLSATSKDAVNGSQLYAANVKVADALGGNSTVDAQGNLTAPQYNLVDGKPSEGKPLKTYNNVGDALTALNTAVTAPLTFGGDSGTAFERKLGSKVNVQGGVTDATKLSSGNIGVVSNGTDTLDVKLAKELSGLTSAQFTDAAGNKTDIGGNGVTVTPVASGKQPVKLTADGLDNGGNKITNVAAGTAATDGVNVSQLQSAQAKATTKVAAGQNIVVSPTVNGDGSTTYTVATARDLNVDSVTAGNTVLNNSGVKVGSNVALTSDGLKAGDVVVSTNGINAGNKKITNVAAGVNDTDAVNLGQLKQQTNAAKTEVKAGTNIASVTSATGSNGQTIYTVNADAASVSAGSTALTVVKGAKDANNVTNYAVDLAQGTKDDIAKGVSAHNTVTNKGLTFKGDSGTSGVKKLGDEVTVSGDTNITTKANANGVQVTLNKDIQADSLTTGNTVVNNGGIAIGSGSGQVSLSANGLNNGGKVAKNLASGLNGRSVADIKAEGSTAAEWNNAATVGDLTQVQSNVTNINNNYHNTIGGSTNTYIDADGKLTDAGKVALKTYDVSGQTQFENNSVISAIKNMNEQGIKFFHVNDGQTPVGTTTNTEDSSAAGQYAVAIGYTAKGNGKNAVAIGNGAQATGENSISIGTGNVVSGKNSGAIGDP
ncbi:MAG: hypothetical protein Q3966_05760, partial [Neisseria sp.]|nr:hypothetical protein [Neisseria sp.]